MSLLLLCETLVEKMSKTLIINLSKSDEGSFGFSLLGKFAGIPHVIYDVVENTPAAECEVSESCTKKNIFLTV